MSVIESASRLFDLLASHDKAFTQYIQPGLSRNQIDTLIVPVKITLPSEIVDFYSHFNFPKEYAYGPDQPTFYGIYSLLGLEDAVQFWQFRRSLDFLEERESDWFPFLQEDGNGYLVDSTPDPEGNYRIVSVFHACAPEVLFLSLTAMFDTFFTWVHEGVLEIKSGHIAGDYEGNQQQVARIAAKLNPGVEHWASRLASDTLQ